MPPPRAARRDELVVVGRAVEQLDRACAAGDGPQQAEVLEGRRARLAGHEPEVDAPGLGGNLRVGLDGAVAFECGADHLLAELVVAVSHRRDHRGNGPAAEEPPTGRIDGSAAKSR
jgi:hypothetical protein